MYMLQQYSHKKFGLLRATDTKLRNDKSRKHSHFLMPQDVRVCACQKSYFDQLSRNKLSQERVPTHSLPLRAEPLSVADIHGFSGCAGKLRFGFIGAASDNVCACVASP